VSPAAGVSLECSGAALVKSFDPLHLLLLNIEGMSEQRPATIGLEATSGEG
jgi:hypothetical protein